MRLQRKPRVYYSNMSNFENISTSSPAQETPQEKLQDKKPETENLESAEAGPDLIDPSDTEIEALEQFEPTGDWQEDLKEFLQITGRKSYLPSIESGKVEPQVLISELRLALPDVLKLVKAPKTRERIELNIKKLDQMIEMGALGRLVSSEERSVLDKKVDASEDEAGQKEIEEQENEDGDEQLVEKRESLKQLGEHVRSGYEKVKARELKQEQRFDAAFAESIGKLTKLKERYPHLINVNSIRKLEANRRIVKALFAENYALHESSNRRIQSNLETYPVEHLSFDEIQKAEVAVDSMFNVLDISLDRLDVSIDRMVDAVDRLPTIEETERDPKKTKDLEKEIKETEKTGEEPEQLIDDEEISI